MEVSEILSITGSFATIVAALGVIYASRQAFAAFCQLAHLRDSQAVSIHSAFQREFREWQKKLPPEASLIAWVPASNAERRLVLLYWEFVFDEWFTCTQLSHEPRVCALWNAYSKGVEGAFHRQAFVEGLNSTFTQRTAHLGHATAFRSELEQVFRRANPGRPIPF